MVSKHIYRIAALGLRTTNITTYSLRYVFFHSLRLDNLTKGIENVNDRARI